MGWLQIELYGGGELELHGEGGKENWNTECRVRRN